MAAASAVLTEAVREAFRVQAEWCRKLGSPFTARLMDALTLVLDDATPLGARVLGWAAGADARGDAVPLRLAGGLHALVRRGALPELAALYPPYPLPDLSTLAAALTATLAGHGAALDPWLDSAPQTNEVARSAALMAGLLAIASRIDRPLALFELGASAGLNLRLDRYAHDLGGRRVGDPESPVRLAPRWEGAPPPDALVHVARRRGVDLNPIDVRDPAGVERLLAYIWPDQSERLARSRAAIALAAADPPPIDRGDAASWLEATLVPEHDCVPVVLHSIAFQYFPPEQQRRIAAHLARVGQTGPVFWLRLEIDSRFTPGAALLLTRWPGGGEELLAMAGPHVHFIRWLSA